MSRWRSDHHALNDHRQVELMQAGRDSLAERAFDLWLARGFSALYGAVARDASPAEIEELLNSPRWANGTG